MDQTARFALPFLAPGQLQKELFHNEALQVIDALLCPIVDGGPSAAPPSAPGVGSCYIVGLDATGAWEGQDGAFACFTDGGWRFVLPHNGMTLVDSSSGEFFSFRNEAWEIGVLRGREVRIDGEIVVRNRQADIADPAGGGVVDSECRGAVAEILSAMRVHGLIG